MSNNRNQKTNYLLSYLCDLVENPENELKLPISLVVDGALITGEMIPKSEYFDNAFPDIFKGVIEEFRAEHTEYIKENGEIVEKYSSDEAAANIPDGIWQRFFYLENARYVFGNSLIPSSGVNGVYMAVRASDISAFNLGAFDITKSDT